MLHKFPLLVFFLLLSLLSACQEKNPTPVSSENVKPVEVLTNLKRPWGLTFLDAETMLITERNGMVQYFKNGQQKAVPLPITVNATGQGGLLDIALSPDYAQTGYIYMTYSKKIDATLSTTALIRFKLNASQEATDVQEIFEAKPYYPNSAHYGSRIAFDEAGHIFITLGDRYSYTSASEIADVTKAFPQDLATHWGKVIRLKLDGSIPQDNPFVSKEGALKEIYSYGHRNPQGIFYDKTQKKLYVHEHGAQGGDELNYVMSSKNYGWPVITYGKDYNDKKIGIGTIQEGMEQPLHYWDPSTAPSSMLFYQGSRYPFWQGSVLITTLRNETLYRLVLQNDKVTQEEKLFANKFGRIRHIALSPDGFIYLLTDETNTGKLIKLEIL